MLANCCALSPVSLSMVGAKAPNMVRWKNESHEHAAIARHGTHICQVTAPSEAGPAAVGFTPAVVDIRSPLRRPFRLFPMRQNARPPQWLRRRESFRPPESGTLDRHSPPSQMRPM